MGDEGKAAGFPRLAALLSKARPHFDIGMPARRFPPRRQSDR